MTLDAVVFAVFMMPILYYVHQRAHRLGVEESVDAMIKLGLIEVKDENLSDK